METATIAPRATEVAASHVRLGVDDVPELPRPAEVGDEAWREVRQAVLQSEAWREPEVPRRRWLPAALALAGAAALALAAYALWPPRAVPAETQAANTVETVPPAPSARAAGQRPSAEPTATPALEGAAGQGSKPGPPIGTSGTNGAPAGTTAAPPAASAPPPLPAPASVDTARVEIRTTREVWMRITVDGEPPAERLVPAGRTLKFNPAQVLVLRAGDAGGLRVVVDGEDRGVLGADGQVVNRRYELSPKKSQP
jgi:cytoskeleton protein RodZ